MTKTLASAGTYFDAVEESFARAAHKAGGICERFVTIADCAAQLNFAGDALVAHIMRALAHLEHPRSRPTLTLSLFDTATTGVPLPTPPIQEFIAADEGWLFADETYQLFWNPFFKTLTMLDRARGVGFFWTDDANAFSYHESSFPLRNLWQWWLSPRGLHLAHAAAVANERGAAVIAGASGAGKSTIALACLNSPLDYLGDDFVLLRAEPEPRVYSLYSSAKLHAAQWKRFPYLRNAVSNAARLETEKALMFVNEHFANKIRRAARARVLLIPRVVGTGKTFARKISAARVLRELAVSTIFLLHGAGKTEMEALAEFARQLPCYELELGADLAEIPRVVQEVLEIS